METTKVFSKIVAAYKDPAVKWVVSKGSTRSGKTYATMQLLTYIAANAKSERVMSVVSESLPHLKRGAIRDFEKILRNERIFDAKKWNATDKIYRFPKAQLEFFGVENSAKVHGSSRTDLFVNEAIFIDYEVVRQLSVRTGGKILIDYNPAFSSWIDDIILPREDAVLVHSTYLDNEFLPASQVREIEASRGVDPDWWRVYGLGETGSLEGLVMRQWDIVNGMPKDFDFECVGIDFGYTNPAAIAHVRRSHGELYIKQIAHERGLDNPDLAAIIKRAGLAGLTCIADSAEPKSIAELNKYGLRCRGVDSKDVSFGLAVMNRYKKHYTSDSVDFIDENRKYSYKRDARTGKYTKEVVKKNDHSPDALRYVCTEFFSDAMPSFDVRVSSK